MEMKKLPSHDQCALALKAEIATKLEKFIHDNEPAGDEDSMAFRTGLVDLWNEAQENCYSREAVIMIIGTIINCPDQVLDACTNEDTDWGAEELLDMALEYEVNKQK